MPNPATNSVTIEYSMEKDNNAEIIITNLLGEIISTTNVNYRNDSASKTVIDVSKFNNGMYLASVNTKTKILQKKFVILK